MVLVSFYSYTNDFISAGSHIQMAGWASQLISEGDGGHMAHVLLESLQELLQLGDNLCVHCFHKGLEALLPQDLLLGLELLIDELLQRHCVHRVLQSQLWDREGRQCQKDKYPTCASLWFCNLSTQNSCLLKAPCRQRSGVLRV